MLPCPAGTDQVTAVFAVPVTVAVNVCVPLDCRLAVFGEMDTAIAGATVTMHVAVLLASWVVTVMVAVPADAAVTRPLCDTVATLLLLVVHVTALFVAFAGWTVAASVSVLPTMIVADVLLSETDVGRTFATVTVAVSDLEGSAWLVAVTVYVPAVAGAVYAKTGWVMLPSPAGADQVTAVFVVPVTVAVNV
jgi:hypothetical protein